MYFVLCTTHIITESPTKMRLTDFCTSYMRPYKKTRPRLKDSVKLNKYLTHIFHVHVLIEEPLIPPKMSIKRPQVVFQVPCFFNFLCYSQKTYII